MKRADRSPLVRHDGRAEARPSHRPTQNAGFDEFVAAVRESLEKHAERKNYDRLGRLELADVTHSLGIGRAHGVAEIIYKASEFLHFPRRVICEKIAGWASSTRS